jgi:hypothetical protein
VLAGQITCRPSFIISGESEENMLIKEAKLANCDVQKIICEWILWQACAFASASTEREKKLSSYQYTAQQRLAHF